MTLLVFFILLSIGVSFICSMLEAVILSVTPSYLASLKQNDPELYKKIEYLKKDIEKPLASILTFNTIAHTVGAAGAGAEAQRIFGSEILAVFSTILTFAILFFSEIIPKSLGASNWKKLLLLSATLLRPMIIVSFPLVWLSEKISAYFKGDNEKVSREEVVAMADIGLRDGALEDSEHKALKGLIQFEEVKASDILTPVDRVEGLAITLDVESAYQKMLSHPYSRVIIHGDHKDDIRGYVLRTKLQEAHINKSDFCVKELTLPLLSLPETISLPKLFQKLLKRREHICAIFSEEQGFLGVITLEDLIEHMLGLEIYDEQDHLIPT